MSGKSSDKHESKSNLLLYLERLFNASVDVQCGDGGDDTYMYIHIEMYLFWLAVRNTLFWLVSAPQPGGQSRPYPDDLHHWNLLEAAGEMDPWPGDQAWFTMMGSRPDSAAQQAVKLARDLGRHFFWLADMDALYRMGNLRRSD